MELLILLEDFLILLVDFLILLVDFLILLVEFPILLVKLPILLLAVFEKVLIEKMVQQTLKSRPSSTMKSLGP